MAIEKSFPQIQGEQSDAEEIEIAIVNPDSVSVETEDGGVMIDFTGGAELLEDDVSHSANLADTMDEADLESLSSELISQYTSDRGSRKKQPTQRV